MMVSVESLAPSARSSPMSILPNWCRWFIWPACVLTDLSCLGETLCPWWPPHDAKIVGSRPFQSSVWSSRGAGMRSSLAIGLILTLMRRKVGSRASSEGLPIQTRAQACAKVGTVRPWASAFQIATGNGLYWPLCQPVAVFFPLSSNCKTPFLASTQSPQGLSSKSFWVVLRVFEDVILAMLVIARAFKPRHARNQKFTIRTQPPNLLSRRLILA